MKALYSDQKGSSIVEAAIVFPFVILVVLVVITITIWFYEEESELTALHINLWNQSQEESETGQDKKSLSMYAPIDPYGKPAFYLKNDSDKRIGLPFVKIEALTITNHSRNGFFPYSAQIEYQSQIYVINEMDYIRCYDSMIIEE